MWRPTKSKNECIRLIDNYLETHGLGYDNDVLDYILENAVSSLGQDEIPDVLMQIYNELGLYKPSRSPYMGYFNKLLSVHSIDRNILDVAGGHLPTFGNMLAHYQLEIGKGTVTVIDPALVTMQPKYANLKLIKDEYTGTYDIKDYDLLIGILPCETTEDIITNAIKNNKDFFVGMCGCVHGEAFGMLYDYGMFYGFGPTPEMYQDYIINMSKELLEDYSDDELGITHLAKRYSIPYPILYNKKRNTK